MIKLLEYVGHTEDQKTIVFFHDKSFPSDKIDEINEKLSKYKYTAKVSTTNRQTERESIVLHLESPIEECSICINEFKEYYQSIIQDIKKK